MAESPNDLVVLTTGSSEIQAALFVSVLASHGIDAIGPNAAATTLRWELGSTDPYRVYVRRIDAERAREVLSSERADSVDIDWSQVDTGAPGSMDPPEAGVGAGGPESSGFWIAMGVFLLALLVGGVILTVT